MLRSKYAAIQAAAGRLGLSAQLMLLLSGLVLLITVVLASVLDTLFTEREQDDIGQQFAELAIQATDKLDRSLFERYREVQLLANQPGLASTASDLDEKRRLLEAMQKTYAYYAWLGITDNEGKVLVAANRLLEGADVAQRPWFRNALKGVHLNDVHEAVMLAKLLQPDAAGKEPLRFIDVAFPYRDAQGRIAGVFGTHLSLAWAADIEKSVMLPLARRKHVDTFILGKDMRVIMGPQALVGKRPLQDAASAFAHPSGYTVQRFGDGKTYLAGYSKSQGHSFSPGLGWTVMVIQDIDAAYAPVAELRYQILMTGMGIAALFAVLALWLAGRTSRPLDLLAASAGRIEAGDMDDIAPIPGAYREIGVLRTSLQSLIGKLRARESAMAQASRRKDEFLATLAHELRNPLAPIASAADLLRMARADEAQQRRLGEMIARQTRHMTGLVDDLLDVSRVTRGEIALDLRAVRLQDVIAEAVEQVAPLAAGKNQYIDTQTLAKPVMVMGDRKRLVQVLANLLNNASKYTPAGGRIEVKLSAEEDRILLAVEDNGIGMSADLMEHAFELFTQETRKTDRSMGGLGVGLALSKRLAELHGGALTVRSEGKDQGSTFIVSLPALAEAALD
jgi:signal transduction histidine kinase